MSESTRLTNLSPSFRSSTASTSCSPRSLSALMRFEPMKPAAPVTAIYILWSTFSGKQFLRTRDGGAELADHDARCAVGNADRFIHGATGRKHDRHRSNDGIA